MAELPKIKTGGKVIKGKIDGVRSGGRNDLSNPNWRKIQAKAPNETNQHLDHKA